MAATHLGRKALQMLLLRRERSLGHEERKVGVFHAVLFDFAVEKVLDFLPNRVGPGAVAEER